MKRVILAAVLVIGMITACTNSKTKDTKNTNNANYRSNTDSTYKHGNNTRRGSR